MKAGVVSLQGAAPEHAEAFERAFRELGISGEVVNVRTPADLEAIDCLAIPGGESTTIGKLIERFGLHDPLVRRAEEGMPILGTCAGCILLAKRGDHEVERTGTRLLGLMDMSVRRNAFGRQRESFEAMIDIEGMTSPFPSVFIRGPDITEVWGECRVKAYHEERIVMVQQGAMFALAFHPELTNDSRIHQMLIESV